MKLPKPQGSCYENSLKYALDFVRSGGDASLLLICHGMAVGTGGQAKGITYGHSWLERVDAEIVIDVTLDHRKPKFFIKKKFYSVGRIHRVVRYPVALAARLAIDTGQCGPWDKTMPKDHLTTPEELAIQS